MGKNFTAPTTTHGSLARLEQRIQRNTRKCYGADAAPQYLVRIQCRRRREWFEFGADLDAAAKLAREIDQYPQGVTHDYLRHVTTTLFAALGVGSGKVITQCKPRYRHQEFLGFLRHLDQSAPANLDLHLVIDNHAPTSIPKCARGSHNDHAITSISP